MAIRADKTKAFFKLTTLTAAIVLTGAGLSACNGSKEPAKQDHASATSATQSDNGKGMGKVIATIDGQPLYQKNVEAVQHSLHSPMPEQTLINRMIELRVLAKAARDEGLDKQPEMKARIQNAIDNQLANEYLTTKLSSLKIPEAEIKKKYEKFVKGYPRKTDYKAAHILVKTKAEADKIIKQLKNGASFADLAKKDSIDPGSAKKGGELGWFNPNQMVPEFSKAVEKMKKGEITQEPVKSKFGWHVIKLEDTRQAKPPTLEQLKPNLENQYRRDQVNKIIQDLRNKADVKLTKAGTAAEKKSAEKEKKAADEHESAAKE